MNSNPYDNSPYGGGSGSGPGGQPSYGGSSPFGDSSQFGGAELAIANRVAQVIEQLAQSGEHGVAAVAVDQRQAGLSLIHI